MNNSLFNNPEFLAALAIGQAQDPGPVFQQAALMQQQQQKAQAEAAQYQQQQYLRQIIPQLLEDFDPQNPREFIGKLVSNGLDPKEAVLFMQALMPEQSTVKEDIVFNPVTGEAIRKQNTNGRVSGFDVIEPQLPGQFMNGQMTSTNSQAPYETPFERKERSKLENDELESYRLSAQQSAETSIDGLMEAINKFNSGTYGPEKLALGKFTESVLGTDLFGINPQAGEYIESQGAKLVLPLVEKNKGAASDKDMELFLKAAPNIKNSQGQNKKLIQEAQALKTRNEERFKAAKAYKAKYGSINGFQEQWLNYINANPIFKQSQNGNLEIDKDAIKNWKGYVLNDIRLLSESELRKLAELD